MKGRNKNLTVKRKLKQLIMISGVLNILFAMLHITPAANANSLLFNNEISINHELSDNQNQSSSHNLIQNDNQNQSSSHNLIQNDNLNQNTPQQDNTISERFAIYYYRDGITLDPEYLDNKAQMDHISEYLAKSPHIDSIVVYAYASPEGVYERNVWLSKRRAEVAKQYILDQNPSIDQTKIILKPMAENWDGLYEEVYQNYFRYDRDFILKTIKDSTIKNDTKKWRIQQSNEGISWRYLIIHNMPRLRVATWICVWESIEPQMAQIDELEPVELIDETPVIEDEPIQLSETSIIARPLSERVTLVALKTNLLYDLVTALNAEIEIPIGDKFSLAIEDVFPWWTWGPNQKQYAFQMWEMGIEPRWWFYRTNRPTIGTAANGYKTPKSSNLKRNRLVGHFVGLYAMSSKYDFQNDFDLCYQGEYWSVGLTYGFSMAISKLFNLELSLSAGYLNSDYRHYQPDPAYEHLYRDKYKVGVFQYFGPTKLKVSLVIPISIWRTIR